MSMETAVREALVAALNSPEGQGALRRALGEARSTAGEDQTYAVAKVAELSGYTPETILQRIIDGDLAAHKPKGCREWRIRRVDYLSWLTNGNGKQENDLDPDEVAKKMLSARGAR
jgi:hypothetical protein